MMKISKSVKGYLLALGSVIAVSNVYLFSKVALEEVSLPQFGSYWFGFGLLWILIFAFIRKDFYKFKELSQKCYGVLIILGVFEVIGTYFFFKAIATIPNPTLVSFIGNIAPAFTITLSFLILKERFNSLEFWGILLTLSGAFIISFKGNGVEDMFIDGAQYILYSSLFGAINAVIIKMKIKKIHPIVLTINRSFFMLLFSLIAVYYLHETLIVSSKAMTNIVIGSLLGPFLTVVVGYFALQFIPLSRKAIIMSTRGLFVLVGSYLYFGKFPTILALLGGMVTIIGVLMIAFGKRRVEG